MNQIARVVQNIVLLYLNKKACEYFITYYYFYRKKIIPCCSKTIVIIYQWNKSKYHADYK